ncbi:MAG: acetyl-CoA carboxylase biotin carboxyl carrier protein subunit [Anaerolineae bacterium]
MAKYAVSVGDREYQVEVGHAGLWVDGKPVSLELLSLNGNGLHLLRREAESTELYFKALPGRSTAGNNGYEICVHGHHLLAHVDPTGRRQRRAADDVGAGDVVAPMPGLVVDLLVAEGQGVEQGEVLVIQESMKMQMQLRAPFAGRIEALPVEPGQRVEKGALIARVVAPARGALDLEISDEGGGR